MENMSTVTVVKQLYTSSLRVINLFNMMLQMSVYDLFVNHYHRDSFTVIQMC